MKKLKILVSILAIGFLFSYACNKPRPDFDIPDIPGPSGSNSGSHEEGGDSSEEEVKETDLLSIKIINAGASGAEEVEGVINANTKTITFPELSRETDFEHIVFDAEVSDGASLDKESYSFSFEEEEDTESSTVLSVVNGNFSSDYTVKIVRAELVISAGADFDKMKIYDYSLNPEGNDKYASFDGNSVRGSGFDGENVLVVDRVGDNPHVLKLADLKDDQINPISLDQTGIEFGLFLVNGGAAVHGHYYMCNMTTNLASGHPFRIYYYEDENSAPEVLASVDESGHGSRFGDAFSVILDEDGNGYIYAPTNPGDDILRLTIKEWNEVTETTFLKSPFNTDFTFTVSRVEGTDDFIITDFTNPLTVTDADLNVKFEMEGGNVPLLAGDARVIDFNEARYLFYTTWPRGSGRAVMTVFDITKGENIVEALTKLQEKVDPEPLMSYDLGIDPNPNPFTQTGYAVVGQGDDETLLLYSGTNNGGFAVLEVPRLND